MKILNYILVALLAVGIFSCELEDNVNPKRATDVPVNTIFTNAQLALVNQVDNASVNLNIARLLTQQWQETTYFNESRYDFQDRGIPDGYQIEFYRDVLQDLKEAKDLLTAQELTGSLATERDNKVAIAGMHEVYAWQCLVDAFGNIPYSEALGGADNSTPAYDDAATVYADLIQRLKTDLGNLNNAEGSYGSADLVYGGDVDAWKRFGASLMLRIGMRMSDFSSADAADALASAMNYGVITDMSENAQLSYNGVVPHVNTIYDAFVVDNRKDYVPTNTIIDIMNSLNDPRRPLWFTDVDGEYLGAVAGLDAAQSFNNFSNFNPQFMSATLPAVLIGADEVSFLLAEAAERGMAVSGTAEEHYNAGITTNILYWGGSAQDATDYLANPDVAYGTAMGNWKQKIGTQKWLVLYNRAVEAWAEWRRLDYPVLNVPEGLTYDDIPVRMPYPFDEGELNGTNYEAAVQAMGGDNHRIKLFWDMN